MIAVRQEVNLQTRAVRAQQEQTGQSLELLEQALTELQKSRGAPQQASPDELLRPLLKTLIDVHDALFLAAREIQRFEENVVVALGALTQRPPQSGVRLGNVPMPPLKQSPRHFLARLLDVRPIDQRALDDWQERVRDAYQTAAMAYLDAVFKGTDERCQQATQGAERIKQMLASLLSGYRMGMQRIERALQQHGLEPITTAGQTFDPELMEVLEAVEGTGSPAGEVLEEVRRGYLWRARVFRYAQVRVARS
jgi:molecular chaperone GrpE